MSGVHPLLEALGPAQPRFATLPNPDRPNRLARVEKIAEGLGISCPCGCGVLMPHQRLMIAVLTEYDPDTGLPFYRQGVGLLPRQSGKSITELVLMCERAMCWRTPQNIVYTAQTGAAAAKKLIEDWGDQVIGSRDRPLPSSALSAAVTNIRRAAGSQAIEWWNGTKFRLEYGSKDSGHGPTVHVAVIDEAFADVDHRRENALKPSLSTVDDALMLVFSTEGDETSQYLAAKVAAGRKAVEAGRDEGLAYFEWSCDPAVMDPDNPDNWPYFMPALGHTISRRTIEVDYQDMCAGEAGVAGARRAYANIRESAKLEAVVIDPGQWAAVVGADAAPGGSVSFGVDATPDQSAASIVACDPSGAIEVVAHQAGTGWLPDAVKKLQKRGRVVVLARGPVAELADLDAVDSYGLGEYGAACRTWTNAVIAREVRVAPTDALYPVLAGAVAAGRRRYSGDVWTWDRRDTSEDISPLVAATLAWHHATTKANVVPLVMYG